jgi:hypothetical protein
LRAQYRISRAPQAILFDRTLLIVRRYTPKDQSLSRHTEEAAGIMEINRDNVRTQDEEGEPAPIDQVEERVEAEMKLIEGRAKERVAQGLQDPDLEREALELEDEANRELEKQRQNK